MPRFYTVRELIEMGSIEYVYICPCGAVAANKNGDPPCSYDWSAACMITAKGPFETALISWELSGNRVAKLKSKRAKQSNDL